jgi:hypothetical protein
MIDYINDNRLNLTFSKKKLYKRQMELTEFHDQIREDIQILKDDNVSSDPRLNDPEYAFNYWVLSKMYNIDDEYIFNQVLEGNDKGIDCYVHYKESKQLFLIQNKYYSNSTALDPKEVSHFLNTSLAVLRSGNYRKSADLQDLFTAAKDDPEYKIYYHLYITNESGNSTVDNVFTQFNIENKSRKDRALIESKLFKISDIIDLYYGTQFNESRGFNADVTANNNGMVLQILPKSLEYRLPKNYLEAYYIMTPIKDVYEMYKKAMEKKYPIFDENIREYLGKTPINDAIKRTLEGEPEEKINFFYYNNGITIICNKATKGDIKNGTQPIRIENPQIVNGCQTVSSVYEVLVNYAKIDPSLIEFKDVYIMMKVLIKNDLVKAQRPNIYKDIVKFTNKQNALSEKAFTADNDLFINIQKGFRERGFLLAVKGGNSHTFKKEFSDRKLLNELLSKANLRADLLKIKVEKIGDVSISIEKLLQVYLALSIDGYYAYQKKADLLDKSSDYYQNYALKIPDALTFDQLLKIWLLFKKAESDRKNSDEENNKLPIPFYVIGFLGAFIQNKSEPSNIKRFATAFFDQPYEQIEKQYNFLCDLTGSYKIAFAQEKKMEYNEMIKTPIDDGILWREVEKLSGQRSHRDVRKSLDQLNF